MLCYLREKKVLFKDFVEWSKTKTEAVKERFSADAAKAGHEVMYIRSPSASKEELVRKVQAERGVSVGVVGYTFRVAHSPPAILLSTLL